MVYRMDLTYYENMDVLDIKTLVRHLLDIPYKNEIMKLVILIWC